MAYTYREHQADFVAAGVEVFRLSLPVGWVGPGRYDYTEADEVAAAFCAAHPGVKLFPLLWIDGPETKWWELENPGEVAVALDRKTCLPRREHPSVIGYAKPGEDLTPTGDLFDRHHQGRPCLHSFASVRWREEAREALGHAIAHYEQTFPGRFAGYYVCAGLSYEWFNWGNYTDDLLFDYSEPMRRYFREWLKKRYAQPEKLSTAWHREFRSFDEVVPPPPLERPASHAFPLLDPRTHTSAADFAAALSDAQMDAFLSLCERAKSVAAPGVWIGGFYGYWWTQTNAPCPARNGHLALQRLLESPFVDFVGSPYDYSNRGVGGVNSSQTMPGSLRAHGKLYINSTDIKLADDNHDWQSFIRVPRTASEAVELMKRDFAFSLAEGQEQSWVDLFGGAFRNPTLREALARLQKIAVEQQGLRCAPRAEALVVVDEESLRWTTPNAALTVPLFPAQKQWHLLRSGFPWTFITLQDFLAYDSPDAKLVYFVNLFRRRDGLASALHKKLRARNTTAIWALWPGWLDDSGLNTQGVTELTGFNVEALPAATGDWTFIASNGERFGTGILRDEYAARMKYYPPAAAFSGQPRLGILPETGDEQLAAWCDQSAIALSRSKRLGFPSIISASPLLPETLLHEIAGAAGAHRFTAAGHLVYANEKALAIYTGRAGSCVINFREPVCLTDTWTGKPLTAKPVERFTVEVESGQSFIWRLKK